MSTTALLFDQAQLAEAAYASFNGATGSGKNVSDALLENKFSKEQTTEFLKHWRVVDQYATGSQSEDPLLTWNDGSGFSATLFESVDNPGQFTFAIRGSIGVDDFKADAGLIFNDGIAPSQVVDMYNYWQSLTHTGVYRAAKLEFSTAETERLRGLAVAPGPAGQAAYKDYLASLQAAGAIIDSSQILPTVAHLTFVDSNTLLADARLLFGSGKLLVCPAVLNVEGHSLGGHLAMAFTRLFPSVNANAVAINGLGFKLDSPNVDSLFRQLGGDDQFSTAQIENVYGIAGLEFASMNNFLLQQPGGWDGLHIETGVGQVGGHGATQMTDSMAVYDLFFRLDGGFASKTPTEVLAQLRPLFEAGSCDAALTLESLVGMLGKLLSNTDFVLGTDNREDLYAEVNKIRAALKDKQYTLEFLIDKSAADIAGLAKDDANAIAYRYALKAGNPFAVLGADYAAHNTAGELNRYDPEKHTGDLTDQYLSDRAKYLAWRIKANLADKLQLAGSQYGSIDSRNWEFTDLTLAKSFETGNLQTVKVMGSPFDTSVPANKMIFGGDNADYVKGGTKDDLLYGGGSTDILDGGKGSDYLEGGSGLDLYRFATGDGTDTVLDIDQRALIQRNNQLLTLAYARSADQWAGQNFTATRDGNSLRLIFTGSEDVLILKDFDFTAARTAAGSNGIHLIDALPARPTATRTYLGDTEDWDSDPGQNGTQTVTDARNNVIRADGQDGRARIDQTDRYDVFAGSANPDDIERYVTGGNTDIVYGDGAASATNPIGGVDRIELGKGRDWAFAGGGNDWVEGGEGGDILYGNAGDDVIYADTSVDGTLSLEAAITSGETGAAALGVIDSDLLSGDAGNDTLIGSNTNDLILGGVGKDVLVGGAGDDNLFGDTILDNASMNWQLQRSVVDAGEGKTTYRATLQNGAWQRDAVSGSADILLGGSGSDWAFGGGGDDLIQGGSGNDVLFGEAGSDVVQGGEGSDVLVGDSPGFVSGTDEGNDILDGGAGNDQLQGDGGDDVLIGGTGNDTLSGGKGKDTYIFNKGDGVDTIWDTPADSTDAEASILVFGEGVNRSDIKFRLGSLYVDIGGGEGVHFEDFDPDQPDATPVIGEIRFSDGGVMSYADILEQGFDLDGTDGNDLLTGTSVSDRMNGLAGNDTLFGEAGDDVLDGGTGDDVLSGGDGNDTYRFGRGSGQDSISEQGGTDIVELGAGISASNVALSRAGWDLVLSVNGTSDRLTFNGYFERTENTVEQIRFADGVTVWGSDWVNARFPGTTSGNDNIVGLDGDETIEGGGGNDILSGMGGNDKLDGGVGNDTLNGGTGEDALYGSTGDDILDGGADRDWLYGGDGNDTYRFGLDSDEDRVYDDSGFDTIALDPGLTPDDLTVTIDDYGLLAFGIKGTSDTLTLPHFPSDRESGYSTMSVRFADGMLLDMAAIKACLTTGTTANDRLFGFSTDDTLFGLGGGDEVNAGGGQDTVDGGAGADYLYGEEGNDALAGGTGSDYLDGGSGNDTLTGGSGTDTLYGGDGNDTYVFHAGDGSDRISYNSANWGDTLVFQDFNEADIHLEKWQSGSDLAFVANATGDSISIEGFFVSDAGKIGQVRFANGVIWDLTTIQLMASTAPSLLPLEGTSAADNLSGGVGNDVLNGMAGNDTLSGGAGNDQIDGGTGNNILNGGDGNDSLEAGSGNDTLDGGSGDDIIFGGRGNDTYRFGIGSGSDQIVENLGFDTIELGAGITADDVVLQRGGLDGSDLLLSINGTTDKLRIADCFGDYDAADPWGRIEQICFTSNGMLWDLATINARLLAGNIASDRDDALYGYDANDSLYGLAGRDTLEGGAGNDALIGGAGFDTLEGGTGNDSLDGGSGTDWLAGESGDDLLVGGAGNDNLDGGAGNDSLIGGAGNDTYHFGFEDGNDLIDNLSTDAGHFDKLSIEFSDTEIRLERWGDSLAFVVIETGESVVVDQYFVSDAYRLDEVEFGSGSVIWDRARIQEIADSLPPNQSPILLNPLPDQIAAQGVAFNYTVPASAFSDPDSGAPLTYSAALADGSALPSWLTFDAATRTFSGASNTLGTVSVKVTAKDGGNLSASDVFNVEVNVQNLTLNGTANADSLNGGTGNDTLNGLAGNDSLNGGAGNDTLNGGAGNDTLKGGLGNDTYVVDSASDVVSENASEGNDLVQSSITYTLSSNLENLTLSGTTAINATGNALNNVLTGNSGVNILDGGAGADTLIGGAGNDTYVVDNVGDVITENASEGTDLIQSSVTYTLAANVENLTLTGTTALNATGNALANALTGNSAANVLDGGAGADTLVGGTGGDTYVIDNTGDVVTEAASAGTDLVLSSITYTLGSNVENLTLTGTAAINGTGNTLNNTLTGNSAANTLNGGTGADTLKGGLGDDTYVIDSASDVVTENASEGTDLVQSSVTYTLASNVENLTLTGTTAINGTGNALDNALNGNSAINTLSGGAGNDRLDGGAGADKLLGGTGDDVYTVDNTGDVVTENASEGTDLINSSVTLTLAANVEALVLTGTSAINGTGNTLNNLIRGNSAANTLNGGTGNDILEGGDGNDILTDTAGTALFNGGTGADSLTGGGSAELYLGGAGNDTLTTGAGNDVILFNKGDGQDTFAAGGTGSDTLSLGGAFAYGDLSFSKSSSDLILKMGTSDQITFKNWYAATPSKPVVNLQVIAEAMAGFTLGGSNALLNQKVEEFNFTGLVSAFDTALKATPTLSNWALTNALSNFQLASSSNTAALGGDLAYQYGRNGSLTGIGLTAAQDVIGNANFGSQTQTLTPLTGSQTQTLRLR